MYFRMFFFRFKITSKSTMYLLTFVYLCESTCFIYVYKNYSKQEVRILNRDDIIKSRKYKVMPTYIYPKNNIGF